MGRKGKRGRQKQKENGGGQGSQKEQPPGTVRDQKEQNEHHDLAQHPQLQSQERLKAGTNPRKRKVRGDDADDEDAAQPSRSTSGAEPQYSGSTPSAETLKAFARVPKVLAPFLWSEQKDPFVKATLHNYLHSGLHSLPDEILVMIFNYLKDDVFAKFCLRRVCTLLRRIVLGSTPCPRAQKDRGVRTRATYSANCNHCIYDLQSEYGRLNADEKTNLRARLRSAFSAQHRAIKSHCHICIGRQGVVRLCEHRHISWQDIERHLNRGRSIAMQILASFPSEEFDFEVPALDH